jgi:hypothetical protein
MENGAKAAEKTSERAPIPQGHSELETIVTTIRRMNENKFEAAPITPGALRSSIGQALAALPVFCGLGRPVAYGEALPRSPSRGRCSPTSWCSSREAHSPEDGASKTEYSLRHRDGR